MDVIIEKWGVISQNMGLFVLLAFFHQFYCNFRINIGPKEPTVPKILCNGNSTTRNELYLN